MSINLKNGHELKRETQLNVVDSVVTMVENVDIKCPHCGESYYMVRYSERTAVYYPPIYKTGVNINPDQNITTTHCTCMNCGGDFSCSD